MVTRSQLYRIRSLAVIVLLAIVSFSAQAHTLEPPLVTVTLLTGGEVNIQVETDVEAWLSGVLDVVNDEEAAEASLYEQLRQLSPDELESRFRQHNTGFTGEFSLRALVPDSNPVAIVSTFDGVDIPEIEDVSESRKSVLLFHAQLPADTRSLVWQMDEKFGDSVLYFGAEGEEQSAMFWLAAGTASDELPVQESVRPRTTSQVISSYLYLGYIHIVPMGLDHILFVLGLFLLSRRLKPLLWQVSAFTLAHTITLALSIQGIINLSAGIVEPLIALSIAYVAIENMLTRQLHSWRVVIVFIFGLLHGMGFAGVLSALGLPESEFVTALIAFNLGVEAGQLSVIAVAYLLVLLITRFLSLTPDQYRRFIVLPTSTLIALTGIYWTIERVAF